MNHRAFLKSLDDESRARLQEKSDLPGLQNLAGHWGLIALFAGLVIARVPGWLLAMLPLGILLIFLFTLLHETVHNTPFRTQRLNAFAGYVCGFVLFLPATWFRYFHLSHHRYTQDPERDPELAAPKPESVWQYAVYLSGVQVWWAQLKTLGRNASGKADGAFLPANAIARVILEARIMLALYALLAVVSVLAGSAVLIWVWLLPIVIGQPFLRLYLLAEHGRCPAVANMFENTRTIFTNSVMRRLAWNMPYHAEHHAIPNVPFHRLPALHTMVREYLRQTERGYIRFNHNYVESLRET